MRLRGSLGMRPRSSLGMRPRESSGMRLYKGEFGNEAKE